MKEQSGALYFILLNIVKNACEAINENIKKGEIRTGYITFRSYYKDGTVFYEIEDNGGGMPEHIKTAILSGESVSEKKDGHGIGMKFVTTECQSLGYSLNIVITNNKTNFILGLPCQCVNT